MRTCSPKRTVFMVEDEILTREFVRALLDGSTSYSWLGGCGSLNAARDFFREGPLPALILLDQVLPDGNGVELLCELQASCAEGRIAVVTGYCDEYLYFHVLRFRSVSFIDKITTTLSEWRRVLDVIALGLRYCSPSIAAGVARVKSDSSHWSKMLTRRELAILPYIGMGLENIEVARIMQLSPQTIQVHRKHILSKLGLHSTPALMRWSVRTGFARARQNTLCEESHAAALVF